MPLPRPAPGADAMPAFLTGLLIAAALVGCQSTNYRAADLPDYLRHSADVTGNDIQVSNLASGGGKTSLIGQDDLLAVTLLAGVETTEPTPHIVRIESDGTAEVPLVGPVRLAGVDIADAAKVVAAAAVERGIYRQPQVTVAMHEQASYRIVVLGAVETPGAYDIPRQGCDIVSAIAAAGGLTDEAGTDIELLRQSRTGLITAQGDPAMGAGSPDEVQQASFDAPGKGGPITERINLAQAGGAPATNQRLGDRDVVMVHPKDKRVIHVTGLVQRPDQFELPDDQPIRVLDALAMAGGTSSPVADRVYVIRQNPSSETNQPVVVQLSIAKAKQSGAENLVLGPGDLVSVEQTMATTVLDAFRDFFRITMGVSSRLTAF